MSDVDIVQVTTYKAKIAASVTGNTLVFDEGTASRLLSSMAQASLTEFNDMEPVDLQNISKEHDDFLSNVISMIKELLSDYTTLNVEYNDLRSLIDEALRSVQSVNRDGAVATTFAAAAGAPKSGSGPDPIEPPGDGIRPAPTLGPDPVGTISTRIPTPTPTASQGTIEPSPTPTTSPTPSPTESNPDLSATPTASIEPSPTSASGGVGAGAAAPLISENVMGNKPVGNETWNNMTTQEQEQTVNKLKELGFSDEEINQIVAGSASVPRLTVDELSSVLQANYSPELKQELLNRYGFDVFNEDGTVNKDKLALALVMDDRNGTDEYSMIELLHNKGIDIVNQTVYDNLSAKIMSTMATHPELRQKIIEKYGFDIFNEDGSINRDKLSLAILMDTQDGEDDFELSEYITKLFGEDVSETIPTKVIPLPDSLPKKKSGTGVVKTLAGVGLLGATAGGLAYLASKKKEKENEDLEFLDDDELSEDSSKTAATQEELEEAADEKEWLYGLGLGLAAKNDDNIGYNDEKISTGGAKNNEDV